MTHAADDIRPSDPATNNACSFLTAVGAENLLVRNPLAITINSRKDSILKMEV